MTRSSNTFCISHRNITRVTCSVWWENKFWNQRQQGTKVKVLDVGTAQTFLYGWKAWSRDKDLEEMYKRRKRTLCGESKVCFYFSNYRNEDCIHENRHFP